MVIIIGSGAAAAKLRNGWWLFLIVPTLALLAALLEGGVLIYRYEIDAGRIAYGSLVFAFIGTMVGAVVAGIVRLWPFGPASIDREMFKRSSVVVPIVAIGGAWFAATAFTWVWPSDYGPVIGPAVTVWLLCWFLETRRRRYVDADGKDYRFKLAMVGFAAVLAVEAQFQLAVESQTCGPNGCGGRFFLGPNPYPFWDRGILGFLPQPSPDLVPRLIYLPMVLAAVICCGILLVPRSQRLPRRLALAMAALAAIAVAYGTPTFEYPQWSHYPRPTLGLGL
ncbi:hypothetical protein [Dongia sp.]|uniref:hypothetical protein n=1 Tax=Dongia sp. TaxID=1977262 RepID=UPI0037525E47